MKIKLSEPPFDAFDAVTVIETDQNVTISEAYIGPILINGDVCLTIMARDNGFEGFCWKGTAIHDDALPDDAIMFTVTPAGISYTHEDIGRPKKREYEELSKLISFKDFDFRNYRRHEETLLTPQLQELGYTDISFVDGEADSFGPLTRVCYATDADDTRHWFIYG